MTKQVEQNDFSKEAEMLAAYKCDEKARRWIREHGAEMDKIILAINAYHREYGIHWFPSHAMFCAAHSVSEAEFSPMNPMQLFSIHRYNLENIGIKIPASVRQAVIERALIEIVKAMRQHRDKIELKQGRMVLI